MPAKTKSPKSKKRSAKKTPAKTSRTRKPEAMTLEEWQVALRREYGREQNFQHTNLGDQPFFSTFSVHNPASKRTYRVSVRSEKLGENFCTCPDFSVNTLGTCKHIEWLLAELRKKRGANKAFSEGYHPPFTEVYLRYGAERSVHMNRGSECNPAADKLLARFFDHHGRLPEKGFATFDRFVRDIAKTEHEIRVYEDVLAFVAQHRDNTRRQETIGKLFEGKGGTAALGKLVKTKLYPYQRQGAIFAAKAGRCLLADDMGLGKTIQAITAVEILAKTAGVERVLVVTPAALKHQWKSEVERFTGRSAEVLDGLQPERAKIYQSDSFYKLANYEIIRRDLDLIRAWRPDVIILDEAQRIKNWDTTRAKSIKQLESDYAIVLSGTPLENRLSELHSIMEFVDRFHLGPLFKFLHAHEHVDEVGRVIGYKDLGAIKESLAGVLLRRRKSEVLQELPERTDKYFFVDMTKEQRDIHDESGDTVKRLVMKWRRFGFLSEEDQRRLMTSLQYMRMSCNSTFLVDKETDFSTKMDECALLLEDVLADPDNKVVIFSQWLGTHAQLIRRLDERGMGYAYYHGSLDSKGRKAALDRFKNDPVCPVLLCTDSGGVGLNLQFASAVVLMDQPWNPAVLEQRIGRVHRLGQQRPVQVYHFVSKGTIEHGMLDTLKFKSSMFAGVLDGGENEVFLGGSRMQKFMETVEQVTEATPEAAPASEEPTRYEEDDAPWEMPETSATVSAPRDAMAARQSDAAPEPWGDLVNAGLAFLGQLGAAAAQGGNAKSPGLAGFIKQNERTGQTELQIPLPDPETAAKLGALLGGLSEVLKALGARK
jgi:superfamily II DNA or RNA helicase